MRVRKAVFPVAGFGTRFLPISKSIPKEMLVVIDKPLIHYAVEEAIDAGITELIFVTHRNKRSIEDYFDTNFELEAHLLEQEKLECLQYIRQLIPPQINCIFIRQARPQGLGHALLSAAPVLGDEPFAVLLADDLIKFDAQGGCLKQLVEQFQILEHSVIATERISSQFCQDYGVVELAKHRGAAVGLHKIHKLWEKPTRVAGPFIETIVGRYILTPGIMFYLKQMFDERLRELQLTEALARLLATETIAALSLRQKRYDCGSKLGYMKAIVDFGLSDPQLHREFRDYLQSLMSVLPE